MSSKTIGDKLFGLHDDIRHGIVADSMGEVVNIFSRAKKRGLWIFKSSFQA